jgi:hypothetical protein
VADRSSKAGLPPVRESGTLRDAPRASSVTERVGMTFRCGVASAGWSNGGAGRCLTATLKEAHRG